eukprot:GHVR01142835.1.p1 GENE.GHVR01142835.1~~GHVR01142835.1.p1  ORF type:complete len:162 (+),score=24.15 GHVR01142835.1:165-650(+)
MKSLISIGMLGVVSCNSMANNSINTNDSSDCANPTANTNFFKGTLTAATRQIKIEGDTCGNGAKTNFFTVGLRTDMFGIFLNINDKKFIEKSLENCANKGGNNVMSRIDSKEGSEQRTYNSVVYNCVYGTNVGGDMLPVYIIEDNSFESFVSLNTQTNIYY